MWHTKRFEYHPSKTKVNCTCCGKDMYLPKSKSSKYLTCSKECRIKEKQALDKSREKICPTCNKSFVPRPYQILLGHGNHCSHKCSQYLRNNAAHTLEATAKRVASFKQSIADGKYIVPIGKDHPKWKGGQKETIKRRIQSGKAKESVKKYRTKNPDKVREWTQTRHKRKTGRLPRGTITNLMTKQNKQCNICKTDIEHKYHMDHIYPLAKGGKHEPCNIQLLCPSCNMRKSAKDPIEFLKEINNG